MSLTAIVALALAIAAVALSYRNPKLGGALLVGIAVLGAIYALLGAQTTTPPDQTPAPSSSTTLPAKTG
ncbi:hypothetical protein [Streptomyces sviceus]|uniref:hypothetical protein n=1 Tax=Streptomyces sviceus TaxID=285530 RepID=UPI00369B5902